MDGEQYKISGRMAMDRGVDMEERFKEAMREYISNIYKVCELLLKHINLSENIDLRSKMDFFRYRAKTKKMEYEFDGISYQFHGKGCTAFNDKLYLDWDFGYRSRWCGIDPWKTAISLSKSNSSFIEFYDGNVIKQLGEQSVMEGTMFSQHGQYYFTIPENRTFQPDFPKEFDCLLIEGNGINYSLSRNKVIDRWIRKSRRIYAQIDNNKNCYHVKFMNKGEVIYTIPYDDIGYPESAVKIMSDDILKKMEVSDG